MSPNARAVLIAAVVFAITMGTLEHGGWWWAWLVGIVLLAARRSVRLPVLGGVRLSTANRFIVRENRKTRRHTRQLARQRRRRMRNQRRAMRQRRRQTQ
jgi:hypothetical protein